ncbi:DUF3347 domain-containing protein [Fulvivirga ligni]|uniref:DUF3347 domain-containing protein n=1 Tax=Fulvivirga ligni TaxID=2904246 RepID=UPI001F3058CD|nr:DUF3347 domain-containing protein [Fulvivirga ligni]UII21357.1 DUF3347 domain-containing protein [Fulvivirga ligni]
MKTMKLIPSLFVAAAIALSITACGDTKKEENTEETEVVAEATEAPAEESEAGVMSQEDAKAVLVSYLKVKNALVKTNAEEASSAAAEIANTLKANDASSAETLYADAQNIANVKDVETQRKYFNELSEHMYTLVKSTKANDATVYRQFCPMAFNNEGAYWLSMEEEVNNPYFGDKMLHCGKVDETIE